MIKRKAWDYTSKYRDAAHSQCNLNYSEQRILTINMHGGSNYDFHMIIKELAREFDTVSVLPENTEKYISISIPITLKEINNKVDDQDFVYHIIFNDTYRFLTKLLSAAVDDLSEINNPLQCLKCSERFKEYNNFCYFDKLRNSVLGYKCEECDAFRGKSFETVKKKFKNILFVKIITKMILKKILMKNLYYYQKTRMFIRMNTWTLLIN